MKLLPFVFCTATILTGCTLSAESSPEAKNAELKSYWLQEADGATMLDPQTSGLASWRGGSLLTIADGSADESQIRRIIRIDPQSNKIVGPKIPIELSAPVKQTCFGPYLEGNPDLEALAVDPYDDSILYSVTEDASRHPFTQDCINKYANSGSTEFPTVLVRIKLQGDKAILDGARPLQFAPTMNIGNHPNDGIEGIAFGSDHNLYLALEKDDAGKARIFRVKADAEFWQTSEFALVEEPQLKVPDPSPGNHPINALTHLPKANHPGYLVAGARNDNQLWIIDLTGAKDTTIVPMSFWAQVKPGAADCPAYEPMHNYSIEGLAYDGERIWLVNDPWKINYLKNVQCPTNEEAYQRMSPLLTWIEVDPDWLN